MVGQGGTIPVPSFGVSMLGSVATTSTGSTVSFTTNQAILPGESALYVLTHASNYNSYLSDPTNQGLATAAFAFGTPIYAQLVKYRNYTSGLSSGTTITWSGAGGGYPAGSTAFGIRIFGNVSLSRYSNASGTLSANAAYNAALSQTFLTGTRVNTSHRSTFAWITITSANVNSPLNGLGQSGFTSATYTTIFNTGNAIDPTKPNMSSAVVALTGQNQYPGTGVTCIQRHASTATLNASTWLFVAP
jgi:hypothetical protein